MPVFESLLALLFAATVLSAVARRVGVPYPTVLAIGGAVLAFVPGAPRLDLTPDLILALFVAPVLLDAAYDASLRDLRRSWIPVTSLVLVAVALTTVAVAIAARALFPELPWAAAVALGALLAPPDAVAALAVMREVAPPHRMRVVLEGESLLNDASALLIYRLAVGAVAAGGFDVADAAPTFALVVFGSVLVGWLAARPAALVMARIDDAPSSVILQFVVTFALWLAAEHLGLSGVVTIVVFGLTLAQGAGASLPARLRVPSFAIWETATMVLNVLAFTLIGLQLGPLWSSLGPGERTRYLFAAFVILGVVIAVRLGWVLCHHGAASLSRTLGRARAAEHGAPPPTARHAMVVGWSGMRGIVTLAAALAIPNGFPHRDFILLTAFVVVLGTLVMQGLTLRPLLRALGIGADDVIAKEVSLARRAALDAALASLEGHTGPAVERLRTEYAAALAQAHDEKHPFDTRERELRREAVRAGRRAIQTLRDDATIGDDAYRRIEAELDWRELSLGAEDA